MKAERAGSMGSQLHRETQSQRKAGVYTKVTCPFLKTEVTSRTGDYTLPEYQRCQGGRNSITAFFTSYLISCSECEKLRKFFLQKKSTDETMKSSKTHTNTCFVIFFKAITPSVSRMNPLKTFSFPVIALFNPHLLSKHQINGTES